MDQQVQTEISEKYTRLIENSHNKNHYILGLFNIKLLDIDETTVEYKAN